MGETKYGHHILGNAFRSTINWKGLRRRHRNGLRLHPDPSCVHLAGAGPVMSHSMISRRYSASRRQSPGRKDFGGAR